jgi:hypothetical protein
MAKKRKQQKKRSLASKLTALSNDELRVVISQQCMNAAGLMARTILQRRQGRSPKKTTRRLMDKQANAIVGPRRPPRKTPVRRGWDDLGKEGHWW